MESRKAVFHVAQMFFVLRFDSIFSRKKTEQIPDEAQGHSHSKS